jgi:hypothetical protein
MKHNLLLILAAAALSACSATTTMHAVDPGVSVKINKDASLALSAPISRTYPTTSFGQYHFRVGRAGMEPMYGVMPLKFNGGYLAADILFFAPATFFNLREVFPFYQFDVATGTVQYRKKSSDPWTRYTPTPAEAARAKAYFGQ